MQLRRLYLGSLTMLAGSLLLFACSSSDTSNDDNTGGIGNAGGVGGNTGGSSGAGVEAGGASGSGGNTVNGGTSGVGAGSDTGGAGAAGASGSAGDTNVGGASGESGNGGAGGTLPFELTSPALTHAEQCGLDDLAACDEFPQANLLDMIGGDNEAPDLNWGPGPEGTLSYAVVLHDYSNTFTHWTIWNLPLMPTMLPGGVMPEIPVGASQASFLEGEGYAGPGAFGHVYEFRLYALSVASFTPNDPSDQGAVRAELEADADGIVLATSDLRGRTPIVER